MLDLLWSVGTALSLGFTVYGALLIGLARERGMPEERALSHKVRPCDLPRWPRCADRAMESMLCLAPMPPMSR